MFEKLRIERKEEQKEIDSVGLVEKEKTLFQKFEGKAKSISAALALITFLTVAPAAVERAYAQDKRENPKKIEDVENIKKPDPVAFLGELLNIPDQERATTPAQNRFLKKDMARAMIQKYASERNIDTTSAATEVLNSSSIYIEQKYGGGFEGMNKFKEVTRGNPGLDALYQMMKEQVIK